MEILILRLTHAGKNAKEQFTALLPGKTPENGPLSGRQKTSRKTAQATHPALF